MKRSAILFACSFAASVAFAQTEVELESIAKLTCECVTGKNLDFKNRKEVEIQLGLCLLEAAGKHKIDFSSGTSEVESLGEKVGLKMATKCPSVFASFANTEEESPTNLIEITGKIKSVELTDIGTLILKEDSGKEHRLVWVTYFSGSDDFVGDPKKLLSKGVTISYETLDIFFPKSKSYVTSKVIKGLKIN
jgi:hypothetical protein